MLIYNYQKEFLGIDEKDLQTLGYKDLAQLRTEVVDFADLFVKTPGYIHNFQHVHWLDFITCAESHEESKVIINANAKSFRAIITVTYAYLVDNPGQKAYFVHLNNLRALTSEEYERISGDITQRPPLEPTIQEAQVITPTQESTPNVQVDTYDNTPLHVEENLDEMLNIEEDITHKEPESRSEPTPEPEPTPAVEPAPVVKPAPKKEKPKSDYSFDPNIASKELGLPLDLIEEFLQDFIDQANDFKAKLYTALDEGDLNNVKILSHKLKGVAANLRIEDAHEVLAVINAATDTDVIKTNLDDFYDIITVLSGGETENDEPTLDIKDEDVPEKLDIPELLDDEFIAIDEEKRSDDDKLELLEDEEELTLDFKDDDIETLQKPSEKEPSEPEIIEAEATEEPEPATKQSYSKEDIANEIGIDIESFNELFKEFVEEAHAIFAKINDALAVGDYETSKRQALKFKGMSDNMRMHAFTNELETLIHSTQKDEIAQAVKQIDIVLTNILKEED